MQHFPVSGKTEDEMNLVDRIKQLFDDAEKAFPFPINRKTEPEAGEVWDAAWEADQNLAARFTEPLNQFRDGLISAVELHDEIVRIGQLESCLFEVNLS
tara:strand:+ start:158 stop:454 length:297 start_codon:yes stop_codon:yes gene_type:complete